MERSNEEKLCFKMTLTTEKWGIGIAIILCIGVLHLVVHCPSQLEKNGQSGKHCAAWGLGRPRQS